MTTIETVVFLNCFLSAMGNLIVEPLASRSMASEDLWESKTLKGFLTQTLLKISQNECAKRCLSQPTCLSFNYWDSMKCELNSGDRFSADAEFEHSPGCHYLGMIQVHQAYCREKGTPRDVKTDSGKNWCEINKKRQDSTWKEWEEIVAIDSEDEWKRVQTRECEGISTHGGLSCLEDNQILEWFKLVREFRNWENSTLHCKSLGGTLFFKVDGTREQLEFFDTKFNPGPFWVGIWTEDYQTWYGMDDEAIPDELLAWHDKEPNGIGYENRMGATNGGLFDVTGYHEIPSFFCDLS